MFSTDELREVYRRLAEPFPEEAIQRTRADETRRGYNTTGIGYQFVVNRLNEVLGVGGFRVAREFTLREKQSRSGMPMVEATCDLVLQLGSWEAGQFIPFAEAPGTGGHLAASEADAKKGAFTNGFKKAAAFFGVGRQAYEGTLDDDNVPAPDCRGPQPSQRRRPPARSAAATNSDVPQRVTNGRVTSAQLAKLRQLVDQVGGDWQRFREHVRGKHGINVEYTDMKLASALIDELIATNASKCLFHLGPIRLLFADRDVGRDGAREQIELLRNHRKFSARS